MPDNTTLGVFVAASLILLLTPGPAVLYIIARSIDQGRLAGVVSSLGLSVGAMVHVLAAGLGVSAILASSTLAFNVLRYAGAAYLIYLGIKTLSAPDESMLRAHVARRGLRGAFAQGIWVNLLNPKAALFSVAFLPQFIDVERGSPLFQLLSLAGIFLVLALMTDTFYAMLAGTLGSWLREHRGFRRGQRYFSGTVYIGLGLATAFSGVRPRPVG